MRLIDVDKVSFYYGGLVKIAPTDFEGTAKYFFQQLKNQPTIDPESLRPHGYWLKKTFLVGAIYCSVCDGVSTAKYNFCPRCGAKMDLKEDNSE